MIRVWDFFLNVALDHGIKLIEPLLGRDTFNDTADALWADARK